MTRKEKPKNAYSTCDEGRKALDIYDLLREAHKSIREIWKQHPQLMHESPENSALNGRYDQWESAVDAVDKTLYLAEGYFVRENQRLGQEGEEL